MITYKIQVRDADGDPIGEFEKFRNLKFGKRLNNYGSCSFEIPVEDPKVSSLIALRRFTVWIYRYDNGSEQLIWSGEQASREGSLDDKGGNWATIYCYDWLEQLNSRYTSEEEIYENIDAGQIAWDLIDDSQGQTNGDFGITEGTIEATQNRDRTYYNHNILEEIIKLSNVIGGFDFEITTSKVFNVYEFIGVDRSNEIILEYGINIKSMRITEDFSKIVNRAIVLGDTGYVGDALRIERDDAGQQALYKVREALISEMTTSETTTLQNKGDALIRKYQLPLYKITMDQVRGGNPSIGDFAIGDIITLKVVSGIYNLNENFRIFEWQLTFNDDNTEKMDLVLGNFYLPE